MTESRRPIFVWGSGRSGTTILANLLGQHHEYHTIPIEVRFIVDPHGLCDVVTGKIEPKRFVKLLTNRWWHRTLQNGQPRGLHTVLEENASADAVETFTTSAADGPLEACRHLVSDLFHPLVSAAGATQWIEMTPPNAARGNDLSQLIPDMKLIHIMRDGRDVACSVVSRGWGPGDHIDALEWWGERLIEAHQACDELTDDNLMVAQLEDLVDRDREGSLTRLLDFPGLEPTTELTRFFDEKMTRDKSNIGRWQCDIDEHDQERINKFYAQILEKIQEAGAPYPS